MPGVEESFGHYWWYGCPHCEDPVADNYGFTFELRHLFADDAEEYGKYCGVCGEFISLADVRDWLEENDPDTLEELEHEYKRKREEWEY